MVHSCSKKLFDSSPCSKFSRLTIPLDLPSKNVYYTVRLASFCNAVERVIQNYDHLPFLVFKQCPAFPHVPTSCKKKNCDCFHYHVFTCVEQQARVFNVWGSRHRLYDSSALHIVGGISYTPLPTVRIQWFLRNLLYIDLMAALHSRPRLCLYWPMGFTRHTMIRGSIPVSPSLHCTCLSMKLGFLCKCACHIRQYIYAWAVWRGTPTLYCFGDTYAHN